MLHVWGRCRAKKNLREAVEGYVESVVREGEEDDFIPRAVPEEVIKEYELRFHPKTFKSMIRQSELNEEAFWRLERLNTTFLLESFRNWTKEIMFLRSKKGPFLVQVLSLERKCIDTKRRNR